MCLRPLFALLCALSTIQALPLNSPLLASYDYIVVGGGPAGLTIANRLSEDPTVNVLLLEAGPADQGEGDITIPAMIGDDIGTKYDWNLSTVSQIYLNGQPRSLPQGHALGGGTILNAMLWNRGGIGDYDDWEQLGNPGWGWADMLPYFMKSETYTPVSSSVIAEQFSIQEDMSVHGFSGPVNVSFSKYFYNSSVNLFSALTELGIPTAYDPNAGNIAGASFLPTDINPDNQSRCDARAAYYDPYVDRPNLWVSTGQYVTGLLFAGVQSNPSTTVPTSGDISVGGGNATGVGGGIAGGLDITKSTSPANGVSYLRKRSLWRWFIDAVTSTPRLLPRQIPQTSLFEVTGVLYAPDAMSSRRNVSATREVIVSAGAIHSPQLLMLSGIGPPAALRAFDIPVLVDLPGVGNNLQDHYLVNTYYPYMNTSYIYPSDPRSNSTWNSEAEAEYFTNRTGPFTEGSADGVAFISLPDILNGSTVITDMVQAQTADQYLAPGLDSAVVAGYATQLPLLMAALGDSSRAGFEIINNNAGNLSVSTMRPLSRGTIRLASSMPFDPPLIDPRYGSNPVDLQVLLQALLFNRRILATDSMQQLDPQQLNPPIDVDKDWILGMIGDGASTEYHPSGTCAMMPLSIGGVVSPDLLVYGTLNLRVVDASIMPLLPASHLQAVVYGIAEKAADIIKAAWKDAPNTSTTTTSAASSSSSGAPSSSSSASSSATSTIARALSSSALGPTPSSSQPADSSGLTEESTSCTAAMTRSVAPTPSSAATGGIVMESTTTPASAEAVSTPTSGQNQAESAPYSGEQSPTDALQALTQSTYLPQSANAGTNVASLPTSSSMTTFESLSTSSIYRTYSNAAESMSVNSSTASLLIPTSTPHASSIAATTTTSAPPTSTAVTSIPPAPIANPGPPTLTSFVTVVYTQYVYS